jgi:hypothetical protein
MATSLIFNSCLPPPNSKYSHLLSFIAIHPSFKSKVNEFYQILNLNLTADSLIKLGSLYFAFLLPEYPAKYLKILA